MLAQLQCCRASVAVRTRSRVQSQVGLDNAGKTTIVKKFNGEDISTISPTLGFQIQTMECVSAPCAPGCAARTSRPPCRPPLSPAAASPFKVAAARAARARDQRCRGGRYRGYKLNIWDVGGQKTIRAYWRNYFETTEVPAARRPHVHHSQMHARTHARTHTSTRNQTQAHASTYKRTQAHVHAGMCTLGMQTRKHGCLTDYDRLIA